MDLLDALLLAADEFGRRLTLVDREHWSAATPCAGWDVHYLVAHVVGGNRFAVSILSGMSAPDAIERVMSTSQLEDDAVTAWSITSAAQIAAFQAATMRVSQVDHPLGRSQAESSWNSAFST